MTDNTALPLPNRTSSFSSQTLTPAPGALTKSSGFLLNLVALYLFLLESRVLDLSPIWWLHIPLALLILLCILTVAKGNFRVTFGSKIAVAFTIFTGWVTLSVPFSKWRFASIGPLESQIQALVIMIIIAQIIRTPADYRRITGTYAYAILIASLLSFYLGRSVENGRLALANGTLADPNEFALALVVGLPFWWDKANAAQGARKIYCLLCTVPILVAFGKTGSRSGLFTLAMLFFVTFLLANPTRKVLIAGGCVFMVLASTFFLPEYIRVRYQTIFTKGAEAQDLDKKAESHLGSDIASSEERKALLIQSIHMTFEHPLFGVGPGVFSYASWDERHAATGQGGWAQVTHNTYTQISSETGIPGFILFVLCMTMVLRSSYAAYRGLKDTDPIMAKTGSYLFCTLSAFSVGIFFLSVGYTHIISVLFALTIGLSNIRHRTVQGQTVPILALAKSTLGVSLSKWIKPNLPAPATAKTAGPMANSKALRNAGLSGKRTAATTPVQK